MQILEEELEEVRESKRKAVLEQTDLMDSNEKLQAEYNSLLKLFND